MEFVYGLWPIIETLRAKRRPIESLLLTDRAEEKGQITEIIAMARAQNVPISRVQRRILDDLAKDGNHQGAVLRVGDYPYAEIEDILEVSALRGEKPFILILDLLHLVLVQRATGALLVLRRLLDALLPVGVEDFAAVDFGHGGCRGERLASDQAGRFGEQEAANEGDDQEQPDVFGRAPHLLQHGA
jgi:hypothetical protein